MALGAGLARLADAAMSRALHGVSRPIFHKGEQVGEWRHYDERLTMFLLRTGNPSRYGQWLSKEETSRNDSIQDLAVTYFAARLHDDALADEEGRPRPKPRRLKDVDDNLDRATNDSSRVRVRVEG
jgi:hypothetical protein